MCEFILYYKKELSLFDKAQCKFNKQIFSKSFVDTATKYLQYLQQKDLVFILWFIDVGQKLFGQIKYIIPALLLEIYFQPYNLM